MNVTVNGKSYPVAAGDAKVPLLWFLRERLDMTGTKFGCGHGGCGACTVHVAGEAVAACRLTVGDVGSRAVVTIEGLAADRGRAVLRAWIADAVPQCGYCQPGMIAAADALLAHDPDPTDDAIDAALAHVLCRCGSYQRVRAAIHHAARADWSHSVFPAAPLPAHRTLPAHATRFNPWVAVGDDNSVVVTIERSEMGQGVNTALATLVAEELDVSLDRVRTEFAPADPVYDNPVIGLQITVGSMSMRNGWRHVRSAGAEVRERLVRAAATRWNVPPATCSTHDGTVRSSAGASATYAELAPAAAALAPNAEPALRSPFDFRLIGEDQPRLEVPDHVAGRSVFGLDVRLPEMLHATLIAAPVLGAAPAAIDAAPARAIEGVVDVFVAGDAVAVVARDTWTALQASEAVRVTWTPGRTDLSSACVRARLSAALHETGTLLRDDGDALARLAAAPRVLSGLYETPYAAHMPIEPANCTAWVHDGRCELWVPTQGQTLARSAAARAAGLAPENVDVHTTFLGGGFGRRSDPDVVTYAVTVAKRMGRPVQLVETRADELRHDRFRPASAAQVAAVVDADGSIAAFSLRVAGPKLALEGIDVPYAIPNLRIEGIEADPGVPTGYWRSVGASQNAFVIEAFVDELAGAANEDPLAFRLRHLPAPSRYRAVLERAAARYGWNGVRADGRFAGVALYAAHGGWAAQIAEISIGAGRVRVHRVVCAVDCGLIVNPDIVRAQIEGAIAFGLTAALHGPITLAGGAVEQTGFHDYPLLTIGEMPRVDVELVAGADAPSGAGECGVPPIAPAVANAVFAATGKRVRSLPIAV